LSARLTLATARRILSQLRHDPRTVALLVVVPSMLLVLLRYTFNSTELFNQIAPDLLGIFPFVMMFLITSVTVLRERTTTTLERLMTMPINKLDLLVGYAIAFGLAAVVQVGLASLVSLTWLGLSVSGSVLLLLVIALLDALLGMALGIFVSAFATTEFQAVQFMPAIIMPQILLCGLFVARDQMASVLQAIATVLPLTYAVDAITRVATSSSIDTTLIVDLLIVTGSMILALVLGAATLRRRTP
jgi:ABC-2 type transport system permease protein